MAVSDGEELDNYDLKMRSIGEGSPVVTLVAGIHGDEKPASRVADELFSEIDEKEVEGTINLISPANIFAHKAGRRETPSPEFESHESEKKDMNRCFGKAWKALKGDTSHLNRTQILAYEVLKVVEGADYVIDMHNATRPDRKVHNIRYKEDSDFDRETVQKMKGMTHASGIDVVVRTPVSKLEKDKKSFLGYAAPRVGTPAVTIEIGGADHFTESDEESYKVAVRNILSYTGNLNREHPELESRDLEIFDDVMTLYAGPAGRLDFKRDLGDKVEVGEAIATVESREDEEGCSIVSPYKGMLEAKNMKKVLGNNERVCKIAYKLA